MGKHNVPGWAQVLRDFLREGGNVSEWGNRCCLGWNSHSFCLVTWLLQKPYDNVFSAESLVIRLAVTNVTPCFSQRELMWVTSVSLQLQLWIFFFSSSESIFKRDRSSVWLTCLTQVKQPAEVSFLCQNTYCTLRIYPDRPWLFQSWWCVTVGSG